MIPRLSRVHLSVRAPERLAAFYTGHLGMSAYALSEGLALGYGGTDAQLQLSDTPGTAGSASAAEERYWKIGITLPDVDAGYRALRAAGIAVSRPEQFRDIGYLCHLRDPEGFAVELLQHTFEGRPSPSGPAAPEAPFRTARIGQVTLRSNDLAAELAFYRDRLGMRLLSVQPVPAHGFTLYFLAFSEERPPDPDLTAIGNREWLWQRPYTTLEIQVFDDPARRFKMAGPDAPGYRGLGVEGWAAPAALWADPAGGQLVLTPAMEARRPGPGKGN